MENDETTAPASEHYKKLAIEPIKLIEALDLNFNAGSYVKYICRHKHKNGIEDLKKALYYAERGFNSRSDHDHKLATLLSFFAIANNLDDLETRALSQVLYVHADLSHIRELIKREEAAK